MTAADLAAAAREGFRTHFGGEASLLVRAPGRINLIGEHTDYSLLPVLPAAIDRALVVAAGPSAAPRLRLASASFPEEALLALSGAGEAPPAWARSAAGLLRELGDAAPGTGVDLFVVGDLPLESGLSSSSAFSCGLLAALDALWELGLEPETLAAMAAAAERHTGVETGGMDQLAIVFGQAGHALRIDFDPPRRHPVPIPPGLVFVVASSGEPAPKGSSARDAYNERVLGARLAAAMLADQVGVDTRTPPVLRDVADVEVIDILVDDLPEKISPAEVAHGAGVNVEHLVQLTSTSLSPRERVPVRRVARHILGEAQRVAEAQAALEAGALAEFGRLLDASHDSLRQDMRCSTPALDRVAAAMRRAGALGARLTGAGFGGFALAAVPAGGEARVIDAAIAATGGPAFVVVPSHGLQRLEPGAP